MNHKWATQDIIVKPSTCIKCLANCGSLVGVQNGIVKDVRRNPAHPGSDGAFCRKDMKGPTGLTYADNRSLYPLRRVGDRGAGQWKRVSWAEAFNESADRLRTTQEKHGAIALAGAHRRGQPGNCRTVDASARLAKFYDQSNLCGGRPAGGIFFRNRAYDGHLRNRRKCCPTKVRRIPWNSSR
jgi:anaerobic selenocysteine-containing dehydrogenase